MKKVLPVLLLFSVFAFKLAAQVPSHLGYLLSAPIDTAGWTFSSTVRFDGPGQDEIVLVERANEVGYVFYQQPQQIFFCDSTVVEFEVKIEGASNGGSDGFAFWVLSSKSNNYAASPGLGIPTNSTGHVFLADMFDNDNNSNNPILGSRYFNNQNYTEGSTVGQLPGNTDQLNSPITTGVWLPVRLVYTWAGGTVNNVQLTATVGGGLWTGTAFVTLASMNTYFGISASNGAANFSKLSIRNLSVKPHALPPETLIPILCTDQTPLPYVFPNGGNPVWYDDMFDNTPSVVAPTIDVTTADTNDVYVASRVITSTGICYGPRMRLRTIVHQSPLIDFDFTKAEGCGADTIDFKNLSQDADIYFWDFGDGTDTSVFETNHIFAGAGEYNVVLRGQNDFCTDSMVQKIKLENPFTVSFDISADSICQNGRVTFNNTSAVSDKNGIPTYWKWDFGTADWDTVIAKNPPAKWYYEPGSYEVKLTVTNGLPCTDSFSRIVRVDPYPSVNFTRIDTVICQGDAISFKGTVQTEGLDNLTWTFSDGTPNITNMTEFNKSFDIPGVYDVNLTAMYRICPDSSFSRKVVVRTVPNINLPKDTVLCYLGQGFEVGDAINATNPAAKYLWSTGDTGSAITIKHHGTYKATVTIDGCSGSDEITVSKDCYINIPNAFSPDGDGLNDYFFPRNMSEQSIREFKMQIYNRYGQVVFETTNAEGRGWDGRLNGVEQPFGVYVYTIEVTFTNGANESYSGNVTLLR